MNERERDIVIAQARALEKRFPTVYDDDREVHYLLLALIEMSLRQPDVQTENNLKDRINSLERELWTYRRIEPSEDAITAAFYALYGRKGGSPTDERDGPELVAVHKALIVAYAIDFDGLVGGVAPRQSGNP